MNEIPAQLRSPGVFIQMDDTGAGTTAEQKRLLLIGQKLTAGSAQANSITQLTTQSDLAALFGASSMLASMAERVLANQAFTMPLYALALDDPSSGSAARISLAVTGSPTVARTGSLTIAGKRITWDETKGDTGVAEKIHQAIDADTSLPCTASQSSGTVTITARHKGVAAGSFTVSGIVSGSSISITYTAGRGAPDIDTALQAIDNSDTDFRYLVYPYTADMDKLETKLQQWHTALINKSARAFSAIGGTVAEAVAFGNGRNSPHTAIIYTADSTTPKYIWSTELAQQLAPRLATDPLINSHRIALRNLDIPTATPYANRNTLLYAGIATHLVDDYGNLFTDRIITTYKTNAQGQPSEALLDINAAELYAEMRNTQIRRARSEFLGSIIVGSSAEAAAFPASKRVVTPEIFAGFLINLYQGYFLEDKGWVQDVDHYATSLKVWVDPDNKNRINFADEPTANKILYLITGTNKLQA